SPRCLDLLRLLSSVCVVFHLFIFLLHHFLIFFFFNAPATTEIYTLSLHDALPICSGQRKSYHPFVKRMQLIDAVARVGLLDGWADRKSTRLNSSHVEISYAVFCLKKKKKKIHTFKCTRLTKTYQNMSRHLINRHHV